MDLVFTQDKETKKGLLRFSLNEGPIVGGVYLSKEDAKRLAPDGKITLTLEEAK